MMSLGKTALDRIDIETLSTIITGEDLIFGLRE